MAEAALRALLGTIGEDADLLTLALLEHIGNDLRTVDVGSAGLKTVLAADRDNLIKGYRRLPNICGLNYGTVSLLRCVPHL